MQNKIMMLLCNLRGTSTFRHKRGQEVNLEHGNPQNCFLCSSRGGGDQDPFDPPPVDAPEPVLLLECSLLSLNMFKAMKNLRNTFSLSRSCCYHICHVVKLCTRA